MKITNEKQLWKLEDELIKKYTLKEVKKYKQIYDEAMDIIIEGSEVEDKKGTEVAQKEYYDEAEGMLKQLPEDYKEFRELLSEWGY